MQQLESSLFSRYNRCSYHVNNRVGNPGGQSRISFDAHRKLCLRSVGPRVGGVHCGRHLGVVSLTVGVPATRALHPSKSCETHLSLSSWTRMLRSRRPIRASDLSAEEKNASSRTPSRSAAETTRPITCPYRPVHQERVTNAAKGGFDQGAPQEDGFSNRLFVAGETRSSSPAWQHFLAVAHHRQPESMTGSPKYFRSSSGKRYDRN